MTLKKRTIKLCLMLMLGMLISIPCGAINVGASTSYNSKVFSEATSTMSEESIDTLLNQYDSVFVVYKDKVNQANTDDLLPMQLDISDDVENEIIGKAISLVGNYYFKAGNITVDGGLYASEDISEDRLNEKIEELQAEIKSGEIFDTYTINSPARLMGNFTTAPNWITYRITKVTAVLDYKDRHFGDFAEWRTIFKLSGTSANDYYAFVNESYITPDDDKTDYRTDKIVYSFDPTVGGTAYLRDYAPKMKNPSATIGYTVSAGAEVNTNGDATISSEISTSYSTLVESPKVYDNGNMANDYGEIKMSYLNTFDNKGDFYEYNISQTYQSSAFIILVPKSVTNDIIIQDNRTVGIQRDSVWVNQLVNFIMEDKITISR